MNSYTEGVIEDLRRLADLIASSGIDLSSVSIKTDFRIHEDASADVRTRTSLALSQLTSVWRGMHAERPEDVDVAGSVAEELRAELARRQITHSQLAAHLGLSQQQMSKRLAGTIEFRLSELEKAAGLLGVPMQMFLPPAWARAVVSASASA